MVRFIGSAINEVRVDTVVIATESPRSALNKLQHQLEYDPPGLLVNTSKVTPSGKSNSRILTIRKPRNGIIAKYQIKVRQPNHRPICK
mmetsp:Transcript_14940/g.22391  ORF Transcript_14940/g.22391 Transcript_14940/m.22391 type:complete len:88 (-) Transcript_14940:164-427(-)